MDRRVKERLVGASILVALIVLIVPELLSGPVPNPAASTPAGAVPTLSAPEPIRNVTVDVAAGRPAPLPETATPTDVPVPATHGDAAAAPAERPAAPAERPAAAQSSASEQSPAPDTVPVETPAPSPRSIAAPAKATAGTRSWSVQLGSFASHTNADKLVRQLRAQGFVVYVLSGGSGRSLRYRVRIGPMADREAAAQMMAKLKGQGHVSSLVPPAR